MSTPRQLKVTSALTGELRTLEGSMVRTVRWEEVDGLGNTLIINYGPDEASAEDIPLRTSAEEVCSQMVWAMPGTPAIAFLDQSPMGPVRRGISAMLGRGYSADRIKAALDLCFAEGKEHLERSTVASSLPKILREQ